MGTLALLAGSAIVAVAAVLAASCLRLRSAVGFFVAVYVLASVEIVTVALLLSIGHWLSRDAFVAAIVGVLVATGVVWARMGRPSPSVTRATGCAVREALFDPVVAVLAVLAVGVHVYLLAVSLTVPQSLPDTMLYHLPRAALWKQQHFVGYVANVPDERVNGFPPSAEVEVMASMILSRGDRYVALPQLAALIAICLSIVGIARRLGLSRSAAVFGALVFASFPLVMLQTPTALNDLVVAAGLSASAYFAMGRSRTEFLLASVALALALGTKPTAVFAVPALAVFAFAAQPRSRWGGLMAAGAAGVALGSSWFVVNLVETGDLRGGASLDRGHVDALGRIRLSLEDLSELSDVDGKRLLLSPAWGLGLLGIALVIAAALAARRHRRWAASVCVAGVFSALALPMVTIWARAVGHALGQVRSALGIGSPPSGPRLPEGFYESAMHSSYGIAFVLLFVGVGALALSAFLRNGLPLSALVALASVPLTVVLFALLLAPDPQRMRYVAFSVSLAAAVFGVALRVRVLAWAAVALITATIAVTLGYFVPRPAGFTLLAGHGGSDTTRRWFVQGGGGGGDAATFRFLEEVVPATATIALVVQRNTYLYPAWDAGLRRRVLFAPAVGSVPPEAGWLLIGPGTSLDEPLAGWARAFHGTAGWRVYRRG